MKQEHTTVFILTLFRKPYLNHGSETQSKTVTGDFLQREQKREREMLPAPFLFINHLSGRLETTFYKIPRRKKSYIMLDKATPAPDSELQAH